MSVHTEVHLEIEMCAYLKAHSWLHESDDAAIYDRARALFRLSAPAFDEPGDERQATTLLIGLADLARRAGDRARAARLLGGVRGPAARHPVARHRVAELRRALGSPPAVPEIGLDEAIALGLEAAP